MDFHTIAMEPLGAVLVVFSLSLSITVARTLPALIRFYGDFVRSGLAMSEHRGYGQSACKAYGFIPAPKLSVPAMALSGIAFLALILASAIPSAYLPSTELPLRSALLLGALVCYHLYFTQLFCEAHVGAHVTVLLPPALLLLATSPAFAPKEVLAAANPAALGAFTCWMMKLVITSAYCGAGVCKITRSIKSVRKGGVSWISGSTLQAFLFEAMFLSTPSTHSSFGVPTPFSHTLQRLHVTCPPLVLAAASVGAVAFETLAPLLLLAPAHVVSVPFAAVGVGFHYGIALLQNIDFVSWWAPAYAFFVADPAAWAGGSLFACPADEAALTLVGSIYASWEVAPVRTALSLTYVAVHVLAVILLRFWPTAEILPLSSFPMFGEPANLFDSASRKWFWLSDKPHATGTLKNYAFPLARQYTVLPSEVHSLPFKYLLYGHGGVTHSVSKGCKGGDAGTGGKPAANDDSLEPLEATLHTNVEMTPDLTLALAKLTALGNQRVDTYRTDPAAAPKLLHVLEEAKLAFAAAPRAVAPLPPIESVVSTAEYMMSGELPPVAKDKVYGGAKVSPPSGSHFAEALTAEVLVTEAKAAGGTIRLTVIRSAVAIVMRAVAVADAILGAVAAINVRLHAASRYVRAATLGESGGGASSSSSSCTKPRVLIVGGSFAGLRAQRHLSDVADVTVVDPKDYFEYTPGVLRLYTRPERLPALTTALPSSQNALVRGSLEAVHARHILVKTPEAAEPQRLDFDYLLLGCGADYPCAPVRPTADESTTAQRQATWDKAAAELKAAGSVLVLGGGLVGVELAAEIATALPGKPIRLLSGGAALCSSLPAAAGTYALSWLQSRGVDVSLHSPVAEVDTSAGEVTLSGGAKLHADLVYDCRGSGPPTTSRVTFAPELEGIQDAHGKLRVDSSLRCLGGSGRIFAMGDVMVAAPHLAFASDLKLGHTAELNADVAATNVEALIEHLAHRAARDASNLAQNASTVALRASTVAHKASNVARDVSTGATGHGETSEEAMSTAATQPRVAAALDEEPSVEEGNSADATDALLQETDLMEVPGAVTYPYGAVGAPVAPKLAILSLGEGTGVLVFNNLVLTGILAAIAKPILEATKVAAAAERPGAVLLWKMGDWGANLIGRTLLRTPAPCPPRADTPNGRPTILFDGVCLLCSTFIHFVLDHDPEAAFDFAPLQGPTGKRLLKRNGLPLDVSTVVLIDEAGTHVRSTAALRVLARCAAPFSYMAVLLWLPRPLRDLGYKGVAAVRYRVFGQDDGTTCRRMTKAMRQRFHE